jgi:hypothetical protein
MGIRTDHPDFKDLPLPGETPWKMPDSLLKY